METIMTPHLSLLLLPALALSTVASAAPLDQETRQVPLRITRPASPHDARQLLVRIDRAALLACGAGPGSLREIERSVGRSACWRRSVADAVAQIDAPLLTAAFDRSVAVAGADAPHPAQ
jgi:UrcA family protein